MNQTEITRIFKASIYDVFAVIQDYEKYPQFLDNVQKVTVESVANSSEHERIVLARYELNLIKSFQYRVRLIEKSPHSIRWTLHDGDIFKSNIGGWDLIEIAHNQTQARYFLSLDFKVFVPKMIVNKLVGHSLPDMMDRYAKRIESNTQK